MANHFRVVGDAWRYPRWQRGLCGARGVRQGCGDTIELRAHLLVTCERCLVIKDWWLLNGRPRLTIRKVRQLQRGGQVPFRL